jgi:hypothetical protein
VGARHTGAAASEVTNVGSDRAQLANIALQAKEVLGADRLDAVADRGYFNSPEILACERETVEHPFGTLKMRMGATHFLMKRLPKVATEMALHVLVYNLTRVMNIVGVKPLLAAIRA